ncbi:DUF4345 domain-containing protein [Seongchinamella unica]|uniref:DUF4345 domain-containing protein n=1 Tax=Seongchinamella unica TaxID=2547392 RepID=A0A4R5LTA2_9GAMM|nr:DUF4345 family protein [Seongchinamella unica]TDG14131.1 DUF4345 domain-containing protein [Seongchinamella unica]
MLGKIVLWASGLIFAAYGVACFVSPELPAGYAGLTIGSGDAYAEMGAMYGGLQFGFGLFCLLAALKPAFYRPALTLLVMSIGSLALARLYSAWDTQWMVAGYTWGALAFEFAVAVLAAIALRKE